MNTTAFEQIKRSGKLPSPAGVALRVLQLSQNENSTIEQILAAVEADPAIASRLLKLVNTPLAGLPRRIASVQRAVTMLGIHAVTGIALGFSLICDHRTGMCRGFDYESFWSDSVARAAAARHVARRIGILAPDEAFTCGLLSRIGRLALANAFPEAYSDALGGDPAELAETERVAFGIDHNELTAEMMSDWHLPNLFVEAARKQDVRPQEHFDPSVPAIRLACVLYLAGIISSLMTNTTVYRDALSILVVEANRLGISPDRSAEMFDSISGEWRDMGALLSVGTRRTRPLAEIYASARERRGARVSRHERDLTRAVGEGRHA